jgi:hypothetical protein
MRIGVARSFSAAALPVLATAATALASSPPYAIPQ